LTAIDTSGWFQTDLQTRPWLLACGGFRALLDWHIFRKRMNKR